MQPADQSMMKSFYPVESALTEVAPPVKGCPGVNIVETDTAYFLELSLPGYQKMNLLVRLENDMLEVQGTSISRPYRNVRRILRSDFSSGAFSRKFLMPTDVKEVIAWFDSGVLYVQLLKSQETTILKDREVLIQ